MSVFDLRDIDRDLAAAHARAAEGAAAQVPGIDERTPRRPVPRVAVVGAGTAGGGIAMSLVNAGVEVVLVDAEPASVERCMKRVRDNYEHGVARGRLGVDEVAQRLAMIRPTSRLEAVGDTAMVIDAGPDELAHRQALFRQLDGLTRPGTILAAHSAGIEVQAVAAATRRPLDVIGVRFYGPVHVQRLMEVVRTPATASDAVATVMTLGRRMRKVAVLSGDQPGYIGNGLFRHYDREAQFVVEDGALPHEVDEALRRFGFAIGLFELHDLAGLDVGHSARLVQRSTRAADRRWHDLAITLVERGRHGVRAGRGWYRYAPGSRKPERDPELEALVYAHSARRGAVRRSISREEILERCLFCLVNEGARMLGSGLALRPGDIDTVMLAGYGFPAAQGGPMFMADRIGLDHVCAAVQRWHDRLGAWWEPAPLLMQLAREGSTFAQWQSLRG